MDIIKLVLPVILTILIGCSNKHETSINIELNSNWEYSQANKNDWSPASVPGCVHLDLLNNGKIEDPFYRLNEHNLQWIDKVDWQYKTAFDVSREQLEHDRLVLDFKGLDTYADIFLNDKLIGNADNMFREWEFDVKNYLVEGKNNLKIIFKSPINEGIKKYDANDYVIPVSNNDLAEIGEVEDGKMVSVYTRKAGYHFGWDWGPRLVTSGIWKPVYLRAWDEAKIKNIQIIQNNVNKDLATFTAKIEIESESDVNGDLKVENEGETLAQKEIALTKGIKNYSVDFEIQNPKFWWTNGLGEQPLYTIDIKLTTSESQSSVSERIGIRTLKLVRNKDENGTTFYFELNGVPVFMKGANYIPNDVFLPRVTENNYRTVVNTAKKSNMNMLRVWGGGIYENDIFYDLCDEAGILVWQDFMFACAMFPGDKEFLDNVAHEAEDNIKRLRNHPSIALWCGNNEILSAWYGWGWREQAIKEQGQEVADRIWKSYEDIFLKVLSDAVKEYDPSRSYWDSSPSSGRAVYRDLNNGDEHYWGVWWGKEPFEKYATHLARFMSEYGFQSFPELETVKTYALPEDFDIYSDVMKSHQRSTIGNGTITEYMMRDYREPKDFESFLYLGQVLQAEGIKFAMEGHRRAMPYTMGSLYWQINDCWPVASWSSTDYYQRWKALQYFARDAFAPVLISPYEIDDILNIAVVNDRLEPINANIELRVLDFTGKVFWNKNINKEIPPNSSSTNFDFLKSDLLKGTNSKKCFLVARVYENDTLLHRNTFYFNKIKDLELPISSISTKITEKDDEYWIELQSNALAKNVYLSIDDNESEVFFSNNYFDLLPGEKELVICKTKGNKIDNFESKLKIMSVTDTYQ